MRAPNTMLGQAGEFGETISNYGVVSKAAAAETLRYRFPKSPSKNFQDALEYAQGLPGFRQEGSEFWVEFAAGETPGNEFRELERLSKNWKGVGHFIGNKRVTQTTWWETLNPFGKFAGANVADNWIERKLWTTSLKFGPQWICYGPPSICYAKLFGRKRGPNSYTTRKKTCSNLYVHIFMPESPSRNLKLSGHIATFVNPSTFFVVSCQRNMKFRESRLFNISSAAANLAAHRD